MSDSRPTASPRGWSELLADRARLAPWGGRRAPSARPRAVAAIADLVAELRAEAELMFNRFTDLSRIHFVGIGGAGMSGIAEILLPECDLKVSGCDQSSARPPSG